MKTLLQGTNQVLTKVQIISSSNALTSLTNSAKQVFIDNAVQAWNEVVDQLYSNDDVLRPYQGAEDSIIIEADKRTYDLPCDLVQIRWPMHEETEGFYISEYPGGYEELRNIQSIPANYTGIPFKGAISPIEKEVYLDRVPTSAEAGYEYKFFYWRDTVLERATDQFPFDDGVFRSLVPAVSEIWKRLQHNKFDDAYFKASFGRALRMVKQQPADTTYIKRRAVVSGGSLGFDPFNA